MQDKSQNQELFSLRNMSETSLLSDNHEFCISEPATAASNDLRIRPPHISTAVLPCMDEFTETQSNNSFVSNFEDFLSELFSTELDDDLLKHDFSNTQASNNYMVGKSKNEANRSEQTFNMLANDSPEKVARKLTEKEDIQIKNKESENILEQLKQTEYIDSSIKQVSVLDG